MVKQRAILHCDLNSFYASVACRENPQLRLVPMVVGGDTQLRHGIVLAKNELAKALNIQTAEPLTDAFKKCPNLVVVRPDFDAYHEVSQAVRQIYLRYTSQVEPFGIDEAWLDVTGSRSLYGDAMDIAEKIRQEVRQEQGVTVSIGVSFTKVFAKLGSDMKKPDAITCIGPEDVPKKVWPLPVGQLLYAGRSTCKRLWQAGILTIGDLAATSPVLLDHLLGKHGPALWASANGMDDGHVAEYGHTTPAKSIGNSTTAPRDLVTQEDVRYILFALADTVGARLREEGVRGSTLQLWMRHKDFSSQIKQKPLPPTQSSQALAEAALELLKNSWDGSALRALGLTVTQLTPMDTPDQVCFFARDTHERRTKLERSVDALCRRYGDKVVQRALFYTDSKLGESLHLGTSSSMGILPQPNGK